MSASQGSGRGRLKIRGAPDGRSQNRSGKCGSHLLRSFLRLQEPSERATPQKRKEVSGEKQTPTVGSRHWGLCQPFLNVGSILQKHISVLACKYFCAPTPSDQNTPEDMDKDKDVCNRLLFTPARPQSTLSSEAASLGVSRVTLREDLVATACAAWQAGCMSWSANLASVVRGIQDGKLHCVALLKQRLYDETPLKLRVPTDDNKFHQLGAKADSCVAKIMQTRYRIGVVVRDLATDQHIFVKGLVPTLLHALQRTRGQDICLSQQRVIESVPEVDQLASLCEPDGISVDITTADRYVANPAAEAALQQLRPEDCALHTDCEVHRLSTSINWSLEDVSHHVSGLIATSLVLRQAGCLARFRDHLCDEIESRLVITHGPPAGGREQAYREAVYAAFLGLDVCRPQDKKSLRSRKASQKAVLEYFMCGDLQGEAVQVFTRGLDATQPEVMALVKHAIIPALLPGSMPSYARHRWLGGELAVDYLGLLEGHNKLFSCTVRRMFAAGPQQQLPHSVPALTGWEALEDAIVQHAEAQDEDKGKDDKDQEAEEAAAKVMESELDPASVAEAGWVEFNKSMQDKMKRWALGYDLAMLSLMRCILGISARLMYRLLQRSSSNWDQEQQSKLLTAEGRSYRASEAFLKGDIEACFVQLHKAFHEAPIAVPDASMTRSHRVQMFKLLSRFAGALEHLLGSLREGYLLSFLLTNPDEEIAADILQTKESLLDGFSQRMLSMFPTPDELLSDTCLAILHAVYDLLPLDVATIEARHASVRALMESKQVSWEVVLQTLSADFLLRQTTLQNDGYQRLTSTLPLHASIPKSPRCELPKTDRRKKVGPAKKRSTGGGSQRAFFRERMQEFSSEQRRKGNLGQVYKQLHAEYRRLPAERVQHFARLGAAAVSSRHAGARGFVRRRRTRTVSASSTFRNSLESLELLPDLESRSKRLLQESRSRAVALNKSQKDALEREESAVAKQRQLLGTQSRCPVGVPTPCAAFVPTLDKIRTYDWCTPAADWAKAVQHERSWSVQRLSQDSYRALVWEF